VPDKESCPLPRGQTVCSEDVHATAPGELECVPDGHGLHPKRGFAGLNAAHAPFSQKVLTGQSMHDNGGSLPRVRTTELPGEHVIVALIQEVAPELDADPAGHG